MRTVHRRNPPGPQQASVVAERRPEVLRTEDWRSAHDRALEANEPVFIPLETWADDRGFSLMNLFQRVLTPEGQINVSLQHPGVVKAWHRHQKQTDFWMCVGGHLKAGVYRDGEDFAWSIVSGDRRPGVLIIPPPLWHGAATIGPTGATLLYYVTRAFDPHDPDEERRAWDSVSGFNWQVRHR